MEYVPGGWETVLLALAAFRLTRFIGWDSLTEGLRDRYMVTTVVAKAEDRSGNERRLVVKRAGMIAKMIECPWCIGWWMALAWWGAWLAWPEATLIAATPWALSALVGLLAKNLDP